MRSGKKIISLLLMLCVILSITVVSFAESNTYMIRVFYGGAQENATTKRSGIAFSKEYSYGEECKLNEDFLNDLLTAYKDGIPGTKYYLKGIRESGGEEEHESVFNVYKDEDFVLTYGIRGEQVTYYVRYVDSNGNQLHARSGPFTANSGDRVYVAYIEIAGYQPDAYNKVRTLTGDYTFDFVYTRTPTTTTTTGGGGGGGGAAAAAANAAANANNQNNANNANNQNNANNPNNPNNPQGANNPAGNNTNIPTQPYDIIDEDQIPLADFPGGVTANNGVTPSAPKVIEPNTHNRLPSWALVASSVALVGLIAMLYWYLLFYRKKKKYATAGGDIDFGDYEEDDDF